MSWSFRSIPVFIALIGRARRRRLVEGYRKRHAT
jgi:hypothetical protein